MLEARDAIGGTWDLFRYPGVRSDSDVQTYAYAWKPWTNDDTVADGDAILRYLDDAVDEHDLRRHVRFGHRVQRIEWSSADSCWTVDVERVDTGEAVRIRCWWIVAGTGYFRYDQGHLPEFAGVDRFQGPYFHAQEWPDDLDVDGARVVVIGSGATAATLIPALADRGAHVTMLQRSPSYYVSLPTQDPIADAFRRRLPPARALEWTRRKNQATQALFYRLCRWFPTAMRRLLVGDATRRLPDGYDVATHFTPGVRAVGPTDVHRPRRRSLPGDLVGTRRRRHRTSSTRSPNDGIRLVSGEELDADVVIAATGLEVLALGDMQVVVDGEALAAGERVVYKSVMLSDVPNFAYVFGYTNASWTLKVDLACAWVCRVLAHMRRTGATKAVVSPDDPDDADAFDARPRGRLPHACGRTHPATGDGRVVGPEELPRRRTASAARSDRRRRAAVLRAPVAADTDVSRWAPAR